MQDKVIDQFPFTKDMVNIYVIVAWEPRTFKHVLVMRSTSSGRLDNTIILYIPTLGKIIITMSLRDFEPARKLCFSFKRDQLHNFKQ